MINDPITSRPAAGGRVTLINAFTVPPPESERFLRRWSGNARIMAAQPGFRRARMFRALDDETERRFVNVAEWESRDAFDRATANPEWRASARRLVDDPELHVTARPSLYVLVADLGPGGRP